MTAWIVTEGEALRYDPERLPPRETYGRDWIYVEAQDADTALAIAAAWDDTLPGHGPAEVELFAAAYRAGVVLLPSDAWVTLDDIAERAGVSRATVQSWRRRHPSFPAALDERPRWAWSDVVRWLAIPRRPGRPRAL